MSSKKSDLGDIVQQAQTNKQYNKKTIVFLDEIHRWNKAQQDSLLPYVEDGTIILIGATTENPSFTINNALLSRCKVLVFSSHTQEDIQSFLRSHLEAIV
ncbi:MAG: AAA family ATPase [bacterium]